MERAGAIPHRGASSFPETRPGSVVDDGTVKLHPRGDQGPTLLRSRHARSGAPRRTAVLHPPDARRQSVRLAEASPGPRFS